LFVPFLSHHRSVQDAWRLQLAASGLLLTDGVYTLLPAGHCFSTVRCDEMRDRISWARIIVCTSRAADRDRENIALQIFQPSKPVFSVFFPKQSVLR
jgi:hypothetical protein